MHLFYHIKIILVIIISLIATASIFSCKTQEPYKESSSGYNSPALSQSSSTSPYPITIKQADNTTIQVIGKGNRENPYVETIDGYTIMKNKSKIYEYVIIGIKGQLELSGVKANDPNERNLQEIEFLITSEKHLRNK